MFFAKLLPREGNFFELFNEHDKHIVTGARAFMAMVQHYSDETLRAKDAAEVHSAENQADRITAEVHRLLHKGFITPYLAATLGKRIVQQGMVAHHVVFGALIGASAWNLVTWFYGIPLLGFLLGALMMVRVAWGCGRGPHPNPRPKTSPCAGARQITPLWRPSPSPPWPI